MSEVLPPVVAILDANVAAFKARMAEVPTAAQAAMRKVEASTVAANAAFRQMEAAASRLAAAQKALTDVQNTEGVSADTVAAAQARVTAAQDAMATSTERAVLAYDRVEAAQQNYARVAKETSAEFVASQQAEADAAKASAAAQKLAAEQAAAAQKAAAEASVARMESLKGAMVGLAEFGKTAAIAVAAIAYETTKTASAFDAGMERLHTQAGVAQAAIGSLSTGVLGLAGDVAQSPKSLAEALFHVESTFASTGITGQKALDILRVAAEGATVGHANLVDVTNALDAAIASGIPGVENYQQAMGALNATVGAGDMQMQDLADAFSSGLLAIGKQYGATLNDVSAALATFGDNNIRGRVAATDLRMAIMDLTKQGPPGVAALMSIGITAGQLGKDMQTGGLNKAIIDLRNHLTAAGITGTKVGAFLEDAFTKKSSAPLAVLMGQFDRLQSKYADITKSANSFGDAWTSTTKTFQFQWDSLKAAVEALGIQLGNVLIPVLSKVMGYIKQGIQWLEQHRQVALALAVALGSVLAVAIGAAAVAFVAAHAAVIAITGGIAALAGGFYLLYERSQPVRDAVSALGRAFQSEIMPALRDAWNMIVAQVGPAFDQLKKAVSDNRPELEQAARVVGVLLGAWAKFQLFIDSQVIRALGALVGFIASAVIGNITSAIRWVGLLVDAWHRMADATTIVGQRVRQIWDAVWADVEAATRTAQQVMQQVFTAIDASLAPVRLAVAVFKMEWQIAWAAVAYSTRVVWAELQILFNQVRAYLAGPLSAGFHAVQQVWDSVWGGIRGALAAAWGYIHPTLDAVQTQGTDKVASAATTLQRAWAAVWASVKAAIADAANFISNTAGRISGAVSGIISKINSVTSAVGGFGSSVSNWFNNLPIPHAAGGSVTPGQTYLVGEKGPELFTSNTSGYIVPNGSFGAGGGGGGVGSVTIPVTLVLDGKVLYQSTQQQALRRDRRNRPGQPGLSY